MTSSIIPEPTSRTRGSSEQPLVPSLPSRSEPITGGLAKVLYLPNAEAYGVQDFKSKKPRLPRVLDLAFEHIASATDESLTLVERSNAFDAWKSSLTEVSMESADHRTEFRQTLGLLIQVSHKVDVVEFAPEVLRGFLEATNSLRPSPSSMGVDTLVALLKKHRISPTIPIAVDDLSNEAQDRLAKLASALGLE